MPYLLFFAEGIFLKRGHREGESKAKMNIHCLFSVLWEVSGEMQRIKALQHSSIMENHGVAVAAKTQHKLYHHRISGLPLNCRCLLKSTAVLEFQDKHSPPQKNPPNHHKQENPNQNSNKTKHNTPPPAPKKPTPLIPPNSLGNPRLTRMASHKQKIYSQTL